MKQPILGERIMRTFPEVDALDSVDFNLNEGEIQTLNQTMSPAFNS